MYVFLFSICLTRAHTIVHCSFPTFFGRNYEFSMRVIYIHATLFADKFINYYRDETDSSHCFSAARFFLFAFINSNTHAQLSAEITKLGHLIAKSGESIIEPPNSYHSAHEPPEKYALRPFNK